MRKICSMTVAGALALTSLQVLAEAQSGEAAFRDVYEELVETNTTLSAGDCTLAAQRSGLNEYVGVQSLLDGRVFLYRLVKLYADAK